MKILITHQGFSLIELAVALVILSVGLLGVVSLQLAALNDTKIAYFQSIAIIQGISLLERIRINQTPTARERELKQWQYDTHLALPEGHGSYQCVGEKCCVKLFWFQQQVHSLTIGKCNQ